MNFHVKVHALTQRNHTAATINLQLTPRNMEPYGHSALKRKKVGGKCPEHMLSQGSLEQRETLLFTSLITFPECCIYWCRAHKSGLSQLYRRHINVTAVLFNSHGLISPLHSRQEMEIRDAEGKKKRGNSATPPNLPSPIFGYCGSFCFCALQRFSGRRSFGRRAQCNS